MSTSISALAATSRLFSAAVFKQLAKGGSSPMFARLLNEIGLAKFSDARFVSDALDTAFRTLSVPGRRDEYVYKTAIARKILLGRHNLRTATMLTEVRVEDSKADVVVLNGTSTVYEIKSERDSLVRLPSQLDSYRRSFACVNVITSAEHAHHVAQIAPKDVGVLILNNRGQISETRKATCDPERVQSDNLMSILRSHEAVEVLIKLGREVPSIPNTQRYRALQKMFSEVDPVALHDTVTEVLRRSRSQNGLGSFLSDIPSSLHAAALCIPIRSADRIRVVEAVNTPIDEAIAWK